MRQLILRSLLGFVIVVQLSVLSSRQGLHREGKGWYDHRDLDQLDRYDGGHCQGRPTGERETTRRLDDLHNQLHAFDNTICCVDKNKRDLPAYDLLVTHNKELWAIFKRAWKFKDDQPQRSLHMELFATEVRERRDSLHALQ
jgi:hypothetical protein